MLSGQSCGLALYNLERLALTAKARWIFVQLMILMRREVGVTFRRWFHHLNTLISAHRIFCLDAHRFLRFVRRYINRTCASVRGSVKLSSLHSRLVGVEGCLGMTDSSSALLCSQYPPNDWCQVRLLFKENRRPAEEPKLWIWMLINISENLIKQNDF
jgi:hypothetical protein